MVQYEEKTLKLRICTIIPPCPLEANDGSDRCWTFACTDHSDDVKGVVQSCAIKFKNSEIAEKFKLEYEKYQKKNQEANDNVGKETTAEPEKEGKKEEVAPKEEAKKEEAKKEEEKKETA